MSWHLGRMAALDFESSDKDAQTARIVTCALILVGGGLPTDTRTWLLNPGIPMEPGAIAVHGITDEYAAEHGMPAEQGVTEIVKAISEVVAADVPLVGHNIGRYDLNLLDCEAHRHLDAPLDEAIPDVHTRMNVLDTMVMDKQVAPFRRRVSENQGPYQMKTTAQVYGLGWDDKAAHGAEYDALMSARAAWHMGNIAHLPRDQRPVWVHQLRTQRFDSLAGVSVADLHQMQTEWARRDAASYQSFLRNPQKAGDKYDKNAYVEPAWPLIPRQQTGDR